MSHFSKVNTVASKCDLSQNNEILSVQYNPHKVHVASLQASIDQLLANLAPSLPQTTVCDAKYLEQLSILISKSVCQSLNRRLEVTRAVKTGLENRRAPSQSKMAEVITQLRLRNI
jgi:hypothetical protein